MKKKLLGIIFGFALIFPCMVFLSSCEEEQVKINDIYVKINEYKNSYLGTFDYGQLLDFSNVKIIAQYSDNTEKDITKDENLIATYQYNSEKEKPFSELSVSPDAGKYVVRFKYNDFNTLLDFNIEQTQYKQGYKISLNKQVWNYDQTPSTINLVGHPDSVDSYDTAYYITKENYESYITLEKEEEKEDYLNSNSYSYPENIYDIIPGEYYAYASISDTTNYKGSLSNLVKFVVYKGTLTKTNEAECNAISFTYNDQIGDFSLDNISLYYNIENTQFVDANGKEVRGRYSWVNPEIKVNYSKSGSSHLVKFVPNDNYWNVENYGLVSISINQGEIEYPNNEFTNNITYSAEMSKLDLFEIYDQQDTYLDFITITKSINDGDFEACDTIVRNENQFSDNSVNSIGKYKYKLSLKDKTNYCWRTISSTEDLIYTYNVNKIPSYIWEETNDTSLILDCVGKVKIEINTTNASYLEGSINATRLDYLDNYPTPTPSTIDCTFDFESENDKTYLIIYVKEFTNENNYGIVGINITATGTNNYEDIDYKFNVYIYKYDASSFLFNAKNSFENENTNVDENGEFYMPVGTNILDLFKINNYDLNNDYGKIRVEISTDKENWTEVTSSDEVTEICQIYARFVFISNNEVYCESIKDISKTYTVYSNYSKSKITMQKDTPFNFVSEDASGIWLYFDVSQEPRGNVGWEVTITASNTSSTEIPKIFNLYESRHQNLINLESSPNATIDNFEPTINSDEYSFSFDVLLDYHIFIYVEFSTAVDVNITYSVAPKDTP